MAMRREGDVEGLMVTSLFVALFDGVLMLFLLDLGVVAVRRLRDLHKLGWSFIAFALLLPVLLGVAGAGLGTALGLSIGGAAAFGAMLASTSYIAAPTAIRTRLPEANPSLYLTAALGITFPLNLWFDIPLYLAAAQYFAGSGASP